MKVVVNAQLELELMACKRFEEGKVAEVGEQTDVKEPEE